MRMKIVSVFGFLAWTAGSSDPKLLVTLPFTHSDDLGPILNSEDLYLGATLLDTCGWTMVWWAIFYLGYYPHLSGLASTFISSHPAAHTCFFLSDRLHTDIWNGYSKFKDGSSQHCAGSQSQLGHGQFLVDGEKFEFQVQSAEFGRRLPVADLSEGAFGGICEPKEAETNDPLGLQSAFHSTYSATWRIFEAEPKDGCLQFSLPDINALHLRGVVLERGNCSFSTKARNAVAAGATALIVFNTEGESLIPMSGEDFNGVESLVVAMADAEVGASLRRVLRNQGPGEVPVRLAALNYDQWAQPLQKWPALIEYERRVALDWFQTTPPVSGDLDPTSQRVTAGFETHRPFYDLYLSSLCTFQFYATKHGLRPVIDAFVRDVRPVDAMYLHERNAVWRGRDVIEDFLSKAATTVTQASPSAVRSIVFCPPVTKKPWNGYTARFGKAGVSGSHTQVLYLAEAFARQGWETIITGGVIEAENINGVRYLGMSSPILRRDGGFDMVISDFGLLNYHAIDARHVVFIMGCQTLINLSVTRAYIDHQRSRFGCRDFKVSFVHRAPWAYEAFKRAHRFEFDFANHIIGFHAGVERMAGNYTGERRRHSVIFHALPERGGAMALRIFEALGWADGTIDYFAYANQNNADTDFINAHAATDPRIRVRGSASKAELFSDFRTKDYFFYPCTARSGMIHKDTFANVVAEAMAHGVIVVAPNLAALPEIYEDYVLFVDAPESMLEYTATGPVPNVDFAFSSPDMVQAYVKKIWDLEAEPVRKEEFRSRSSEWARHVFDWNASTAALMGNLLSDSTDSCIQKINQPPPARGPFKSPACDLFPAMSQAPV